MRFMLGFIVATATTGITIGYIVREYPITVLVIGVLTIVWVTYRVIVKPFLKAQSEAVKFGEESASS